MTFLPKKFQGSLQIGINYDMFFVKLKIGTKKFQKIFQYFFFKFPYLYLLINIFQQPITTSKEIHVIKTSMDDKSKEAINSIIEHKYGTMKKDNEEQV